MESDRIERQYQDSKDLVAYLMGKGEVSFATYIDSVYKKVLVLSAASYFESIISKYISDYAIKASDPDCRLSHPEVAWKNIAGFRDIATHKYQTLRMEDVYETTVTDFPDLQRKITRILAE